MRWRDFNISTICEVPTGKLNRTSNGVVLHFGKEYPLPGMWVTTHVGVKGDKHVLY